MFWLNALKEEGPKHMGANNEAYNHPSHVTRTAKAAGAGLAQSLFGQLGPWLQFGAVGVVCFLLMRSQTFQEQLFIDLRAETRELTRSVNELTHEIKGVKTVRHP